MLNQELVAELKAKIGPRRSLEKLHIGFQFHNEIDHIIFNPRMPDQTSVVSGLTRDRAIVIENRKVQEQEPDRHQLGLNSTSPAGT
ncbi:unnamed protein product [Heligmosomoides polygyrus]|uniref:Uncharacterized protein n=1 Tax=Heligmosomoides polygyrus TaxID=6339 RepID=A0A183FGQ1_HELPZ|nr:unnamed protein product [Heligmosomoides polygyrus]